jgi:hypothetical protein
MQKLAPSEWQDKRKEKVKREKGRPKVMRPAHSKASWQCRQISDPENLSTEVMKHIHPTRLGSACFALRQSYWCVVTSSSQASHQAGCSFL